MVLLGERLQLHGTRVPNPLWVPVPKFQDLELKLVCVGLINPLYLDFPRFPILGWL